MGKSITAVVMVCLRYLASASNGGRDCKWEEHDIPESWIGKVVDAIDIVKQIGLHPCCSVGHGRKQIKMLVHAKHGYIGLEIAKRYADILDSASTDDLRKLYLRWMVASTTAGQCIKGMLSYTDMLTKGKITQDELALFCRTNYRHADFERLTGQKLS